MYELEDKKLRTEFKKTALGQRYSRYLFVWWVILAICLVVSLVVFFGWPDAAWSRTVYALTGLAFIIGSYFDGKRDGAVMQFKICQKKS